MRLRNTASLLILASACNNQLPTGPDGSSDDASPDAASADSSSDVSSLDATLDADAEAGVTFTYSDITATSNWESFDVLAFAGQNALTFWGAAWDGRYVYYVPHGQSGSSMLVRYDTTMPFTSSSSWDKFDMTNASASFSGYTGGVFADNALYLIPSLPGSTVARFDTTAAFTSSSSYQGFDTSTATTMPFRYAGGAFDGQFIYTSAVGFATNAFETIRYNTTQSFVDKASWSPMSLSSNTTDYVIGALFDGKYVYFAPYESARFRRFDTTHTWDVYGWDNYDSPSPISTNSYQGSAFDGRYAYFIGYNVQPQMSFASLYLTRYDTQVPFTVDTSWTYIGTGLDSKAGRFCGAIFDGRYIYFPEFAHSAPDVSLGRFDTQSAAFVDASAPGFDMIDLTNAAKAPGSSNYAGGAYDGQYLYLAPQTGPALRFKTKTPPQMPVTYHGSFL